MKWRRKRREDVSKVNKKGGGGEGGGELRAINIQLAFRLVQEGKNEMMTHTGRKIMDYVPKWKISLIQSGKKIQVCGHIYRLDTGVLTYPIVVFWDQETTVHWYKKLKKELEEIAV